MRPAMNHNLDDMIGAIGGLLGGIVTSMILGVTWHSAWENVINLIWLGVGAMFTGGMGMVGKKLVERYMERRKNKKQ